MNKTNKILIVLLVIFILGGASCSYYFYSKYNTTKKELDILKKEAESEKTEEEIPELTGNILIDGNIITVDSSDEEKVSFMMNDVEHSLSFKYTYVKNPDGNPEQSNYYSYRVETDIYFDDINITEFSQSKKGKLIYFDENDRTLDQVKEYTKEQSLMSEFDLQIIKGVDNKDYLFISVLEKKEDNSVSYIPIILNSEGEVIYEMLDKITSDIGYTLKDTVEGALYGNKGYYFDKNANNQHVINVLAYKKKENGNETEGYNDAFKYVITIKNNIADVNEFPLEPVLYTPYMEW